MIRKRRVKEKWIELTFSVKPDAESGTDWQWVFHWFKQPGDEIGIMHRQHINHLTEPPTPLTTGLHQPQPPPILPKQPQPLIGHFIHIPLQRLANPRHLLPNLELGILENLILDSPSFEEILKLVVDVDEF